VEYIWDASQESHANTFACTMHASQKTKREPRTYDSIMIFSEQNLQKQIGHLNSSRENIQFQNKNRLKQSSGNEVMIVLKSTKFQFFFRKQPHGFQSFIQTLFGSFSLQEEKVDMCGNINGASTPSDPCRHLHLQQNIQRAQTCTIARSSWSEGHGCLATSFCSFSYFFCMHYNLRGGFPMRFSLFPHFFNVSLLYALYNGSLTWPLLSGPIHHVHPSSVQGGCWRYYTVTYNYFR
jgi:hypothetical protein